MEPHLSEVCPPLSKVVLSKLPGVHQSSNGNGYTACCPAHHDRHPSLSIGIGKEGQVLLHCHAGCVVEREQKATLFVTGRDVQEQSLSLCFDPTTAHWAPISAEGESDTRRGS
jgi:hypothetical protein